MEHVRKVRRVNVLREAMLEDLLMIGGAGAIVLAILAGSLWWVLT